MKVNRVGPQDLRNDVMVNSFEFPFCLTYPRHSTEEAGNLLCLSSRRTRKEAACQDIELT